jgi:putative glutamine amidotransferase
VPNIVVSYIKEDKVAPYLEALAAAGVAENDVFRATPMRTAQIDLRPWMDRADGLLLTGGADIQPALYGEARIPGAKLDAPVADRDQMEWDLLSLARERRVPVFGICRGHQTLNAFLGGSLYQDLGLQTGVAGHDNFIDDGWALDHLAHEVIPAKSHHPMSSWFARFLRPLVNSRHHQAVKALGKGLEVVATSPDGVIEATASPARSDWWLRSVQWHPENLLEMEVHRGLFEHFVERARQREKERSASMAHSVAG